MDKCFIEFLSELNLLNRKQIHTSVTVHVNCSKIIKIQQNSAKKEELIW